MTDKIIEYRTVSSPNIARRVIKYFEDKYHIHYSWRDSFGEIEEANAVCVLDTEDNYRCVTTTSPMSFINRKRTDKTFEDIGEL